MFRNALVVGGAGFVGSNLAITLKQNVPAGNVQAFDNLHRRGSELTLKRLREAGVAFVHGDIRISEDFACFGDLDLIIDCSAEPSVLAGIGGDPSYVIQTNLFGTFHILELARRKNARLVFLSTSRVYPVRHLLNIPLQQTVGRFVLGSPLPRGLTPEGITEEFPLDGPRTLYGASKLASELLIQEYIETYGLKAVINRCGIITGPWQMGKVDQGVVALWVAHHVFKRPLKTIGFGGQGLQVRDAIHVDDLADLLGIQLSNIDKASGTCFNVGGGHAVSFSLAELTALCEEVTGNRVPMESVAETRPGDVPYYVTDASLVSRTFGWKPKRDMRAIVAEIASWIESHRDELKDIL
ncbi:MAG TPA: NAD-dependent epimerase/dehydratase family protein [Candidatus Ozemobacteraceae bacterium]|nr:NAD-dependent epimerase/dehydratase family protein [Candidatus Ozemobacteraceae bacterium]HQG27080.1 NAD-dependent epimerase/dehydratase family protein [Candidatus Ozemobacteraceae bacterium]